MQPMSILLPNNRIEFNPADPAHLTYVLAFADKYFDTFEANASIRIPHTLFSCCMTFIYRDYSKEHGHSKEGSINYINLKRNFNFNSAETFGETLLALLIFELKHGRPSYLPSYNTKHFTRFDELEEVKDLREQIAKKDERIGSLEKTTENYSQAIINLERHAGDAIEMANLQKVALKKRNQEIDHLSGVKKILERKIKIIEEENERLKKTAMSCQVCKDVIERKNEGQQ